MWGRTLSSEPLRDLFFENPFNVRSSTLREATEPYLSSSAGGCLVTYVYAELSYASTRRTVTGPRLSHAQP